MYKSSIHGIPDDTYTEGVMNHMHKFVYHGSLYKYDTLKPTGLDLGNALQDVGWSLYTFIDKDDAIGWCVFKRAKEIQKYYNLPKAYGSKLSKGMLIGKTAFHELQEKLDHVPMNERCFYLYTIKIQPDYELGFGHSSNTKKCITIRNEVIPYKIEKMYLTQELLNKHCYVIEDNLDQSSINKLSGTNTRFLTPLMTNDVMYNWGNIKPIKKAIADGTLIPGDTDELKRFIVDNNVHIHKPSIRERLFS